VSQAERKLVRDQLDLLLRDPLFANSRRYPVLLRYVVEKALDGQEENLKERTIGIEAFGRSPEYDTNADTVHSITSVPSIVTSSSLSSPLAATGQTFTPS